MFKLNFDLAELSYNNTIQVRFKVDEDGVVTNLRSVVDSTQDLTNAPQLVQDLAAEFPYTDHSTTNKDGACCWADFIRVVDAERHHICYQETKYIYNGGVVESQQKQPVVVVTCLDDLSGHPEKVQRFCNVVFTPEVKASYIASLPRVYKKQMTVERRLEKDNPDYNPDDPKSPKKVYDTESKMVPHDAYVDENNVLQPAGERIQVIIKAEYDLVTMPDGSPAMIYCSKDEAEETFIEYKGELYKEDWDGTL